MKKCTIVLLIVTLISAVTNAQRITITVAGNGVAGYTGDGGPGRQAEINDAQYICSDLAGNMYFSSLGRIREVAATTGIITTIAGGGTSTADGIPATSAAITPLSICVNATGDVFFVTGTKIKKIDATTNTITTYAGTGNMGYSGDGGPATNAKFSSITGICTDALGNILLVDAGNNRIRKIAAGTGIVTTFAGTGINGYYGDGGPATAASLSSPFYICSNPIGDIYFTDQSAVYIRRINAITGIITTYAGGGGSIVGDVAMNTLLGGVSGMAFDANYNLCFNEISCSCRKIDHFTDSVQYIGGNFAMESFRDDTNSLYAWMDTQYGMTTDAKNNIYIADYGNSRIRKLVYLTSKPSFAYGDFQSVNPCPGYPFVLNSQMAVADLDLGQTETWTVITPPVNGTLAGFPATAASKGNAELAMPSGLSYLASSTFSGTDSFRVRVSDGTLADTVTIYVSVQLSSPATITGSTSICTGLTGTVVGSVPGGIWSATNSAVAIDSVTGDINAMTPGIDTIIYNRVVPCALTTTFTVTVNPTPSAGTISGNDSVCVGASIHLTDTTSGGVWSSYDPFYASIDSTTGMVTGISYSYGPSADIVYTVKNAWCSSFAMKFVTVNAAAMPITLASPLCIGTSEWCYNDVPGGTWYTSNGDAVITTGYLSSLTGVTAGVDTISFTNTNSCGTATITQTVLVTLTANAGTITGPSTVCVGSSVTFSSSVSGGSWDTKYYNAFAGYYNGVVTGSITGVDTVIYTVSSGPACTATATAPITVINTAPVAGTITGPASVCVGAAIPLSDAAPGGVWRVANTNITVSGLGIVSGVAAGSDSIFYAVTNACGTATTAAHAVTINPLAAPGTITGPSNVCIGATIAVTDATPGGIWSVTNANITFSGSGTVSGIASGSDSILYSLSNTCGTVTTAKVITVNPLPVSGTITGSASVCAGSTISLTDASPGGIWSATNANVTVSGMGIVSGALTGSDSVVYAVSNVCGTATTAKVITINPLPVAGTITGSSSVCMGATISLTDATPGGIWSVTNTHATVSFLGAVTGIVSGSDSILYSVSNVCGTAKSSKVITINPLPVAGTIAGSSSVCAGSTISLTDATPGGIWSVTNANATVSFLGAVAGIVAGSDSVLYIVSNACGTAKTSKVITINPLPVSGTITGSASVCAGSAISLTDATPGGIWSVTNANATVSGLGAVAGIVAGSDSVLYVVSNACGSAKTSKVITINPLPVSGTITGSASVCAGSTTSLTDAAPGGAWSVTNTKATVSASGIVSGIAAGGDSVIYAVSNACGTSKSSKIISINPLPVSGTITGLADVCAGSTISLTDATPGGIWSVTNAKATVSGSGIVSGTIAGSDSVLYAVSNVCGTAKTSKVITINPLPVAGTITGSASVCPGATIALTDGATGGIWSVTNADATVSGSGIVSGVVAGSDSVWYAVSNVCGTAKTSKVITINPLPVAGTITGPISVCSSSTISLTDAIPGGIWSVTNARAAVSGSGVVSGVIAGSDSVLYAVSNVCGTATAAKEITINPLPVSGTITGLSSVCAGSTIALTDGATDGVWKVTNANATISVSGIVSGSAAGNDSVLYTVNNICGTVTASRVITVNPMPDAGTITGAISVCIGSSISLSDGIAGGTWSVSNPNAAISASGIINGSSSGADTIIYAVSNLCGTATTTHLVQIDDCTILGSQLSTIISGIKIYPNPTSSILNIQWTELQSGKADVVFTDCVGREVLRGELIDNGVNTQQFNLADFTEGVYMLKIQSGSDYFTSKIVIHK